MIAFTRISFIQAYFIWILTASIFVVDLLFDGPAEVDFAYVLPHFLAFFFRNRNDVILLAAITTTLTIIEAALSSNASGIPLEHALVDRFAAVVIFWTASFFALEFIRLRENEEQQKERFKALFLHATNGILLTDRNGVIVMANPSVENLFGYEPGALIGKAVELLIPASRAEKHKSYREEYYQTPKVRHMGIGLDLKGLKKNGEEFPVEVSLSPFKSLDGVFVVAFIVDNTYRKNYENSILEQQRALTSMGEALKHANEDLENKVLHRTYELEKAKNELTVALTKERELGELKSRFVSMASHEFRTPLTTILSSSELIRQYARRSDTEQIEKHTDRIGVAVSSLNAILTEFLSLGRLEEGRVRVVRQVININSCCAEVYDLLKSIFKNGQTLEHRHEGPERITSDETLLKNIFINLISNASKYSPENSLISVDSSVNAGIFRLSVRDRGVGIPEADQKHLFDRFFRAANVVNDTKGTGLGLYIVQRYAEMLNGHIGFSSKEGEGSVFWVEIPLEEG